MILQFNSWGVLSNPIKAYNNSRARLNATFRQQKRPRNAASLSYFWNKFANKMKKNGFSGFIHEVSTSKLQSEIHSIRKKPDFGSYLKKLTRIVFLNSTTVQRKKLAQGRNFENQEFLRFERK